MDETPSRDREDGRATGQPSRGTAGLDPRRTFQYAARFPATSSGQASPKTARLRAVQKGGDGGGRVICETKRIRSNYVLLDVRQASRTLDATPLQGRALQYTINDATMRLCGLVRLRRGRSPYLTPSGRSRRFVHNAGLVRPPSVRRPAPPSSWTQGWTGGGEGLAAMRGEAL